MSELFTFEGFEKGDIEHFGIKGQKWGIRRYQNPDGSLTPLGEQRYGKRSKGRSGKKAKDKSSGKSKSELKDKFNSESNGKVKKNIQKAASVTKNFAKKQVGKIGTVRRVETIANGLHNWKNLSKAEKRIVAANMGSAAGGLTATAIGAWVFGPTMLKNEKDFYKAVKGAGRGLGNRARAAKANRYWKKFNEGLGERINPTGPVWENVGGAWKFTGGNSLR